MKKLMAAFAAAIVLTFGSASIAVAQDTDSTVVDEATNDDGDTGLIGLGGLLGLLGLLGLKRRNDTYDDRTTPRDPR